MYVGNMLYGAKPWSVDDPSWNLIRDTIVAMEQAGNNQIYLSSRDPEALTFMMIGGGLDGETGEHHYVCVVNYVDAVDVSGHASAFRQYFLENPFMTGYDSVEIVIDNTSESTESGLAIDQQMVLAATEYFFENGERSPDLEWCLYCQAP